MLGGRAVRRLAVIGARPAGHSMTPVMWNSLFAKLGMNARFEAWQAITEDNLHFMLKQIREDSDFVGCNITIPWKEEVARAVDEIHGTAAAVESVNTVKRLPGGKLAGFNTDGWGAVKALENSGVELSGVRVVVGGAGGASRSIVYELARTGAKVSVFNRTVERAKELAAVVNKALGKKVVAAGGLDKINFALKKAGVFINTTSLGSPGDLQNQAILSDAQVKLTPKTCAFMDVVYNPRETTLLKTAHTSGRRAVHGVEMLVMQAAKGFEHFFGKKLSQESISVMHDAVVKALAERQAR